MVDQRRNEISRAHNSGHGAALTDLFGKQGWATVFGQLSVGSHSDDVSCQFQYNNNTEFDVKFPDPLPAGAFQRNNLSMAEVGFDAAATGTVTMTSRDSIRYRPGHELYGMQTGRFVGARNGVSHYLGVGNGTDRMCWGTKDGVFGFHFWEGGNKTFTPMGNFQKDHLDGAGDNMNPSGFSIDASKMNLYLISAGWLGIAPIVPGIHGGYSLGWLNPHYEDFINSLDQPHLQNASLPLIAETEVTIAGAEAFVGTSSWKGGVIAGQPEDNSSNRSFTELRAEVTPASAANQAAHLFSQRSKSTFQGKTNHVKSQWHTIIATSAYNKDVILEAWRTEDLLALDATLRATLDGGYADVNAFSSVNQTSKVAKSDIDITGLKALDSVLLKANGQYSDTDFKKFVIYPGEEYTYTARIAGAIGSGDVALQGKWWEFF